MEDKSFYRYLEKIIPKKLRPYTYRYRQFIVYAFFGGLTTLVNFLIFFPLNALWPDNHLIFNVVAWVGSTVFAFFANKTLVFCDLTWGAKRVLRQGGSFAASRLLGLGLETLILWILADKVGLYSWLSKIIANLTGGFLNYTIQKFFVFRKPKHMPTEGEPILPEALEEDMELITEEDEEIFTSPDEDDGE